MLINTIFVESNLGVEGLAERAVELLPMDPVYFFTILHLGLYAVLHRHRFMSLLKKNPFLSLFLAVVALYVVIYTPNFGKSAIGEARKFYFMFLFPLLALVVIRTPEQLRRFVHVVILSATGAAVFALALAAKQGGILRVVNSECTLIIAFAAFAMMIHRIHWMVVFHPIVDRLLLFLFTALTIGSGQRSVWLAVGLGSLLVLLIHSGRRALMGKIALVGLALVISLGTAFVYFPEAGVRLGEKFAGIINPLSDGTASWRIEGWRDQLERLKSSGSVLFGQGFGGYYYYWDDQGALVSASPHNGYIQLVLKLGLFGLAIYTLLVFEFFRRALVFRKRLPPGPLRAYLDIGMLNFGAGHAFMLGYGIVSSILVFFSVTVCAIKLSENFHKVHKVTSWSPAYAGRLGQFRRLPSMPVPGAPVTPHDR
jgi:O-Antigen ligase